jgi:hypothetical protein
MQFKPKVIFKINGGATAKRVRASLLTLVNLVTCRCIRWTRGRCERYPATSGCNVVTPQDGGSDGREFESRKRIEKLV